MQLYSVVCGNETVPVGLSGRQRQTAVQYSSGRTIRRVHRNCIWRRYSISDRGICTFIRCDKDHDRRSGISRRTIFRAPSLTERLIELAPELDIHIIPDNGLNKRTAPAYREPTRLLSVSLCDLVKSVLLLLLATLVGFLFFKLGFTEANIITIYILSVMLISVATKSPVCSFISSAASVLIFNFFFTEPRYSLHAYDSGYLVTFLVMFIAALITGSLATKLKSHAQRAAPGCLAHETLV